MLWSFCGQKPSWKSHDDIIHTKQLTRENDFDMNFVEYIAKQNNWLIQLQYFIPVTDKIYNILSTPDFKRLEIKLPFHFSFHISLKLKLQKVFSDLIHIGLRCAIHDIKCYYPDISEHVKRNYDTK